MLQRLEDRIEDFKSLAPKAMTQDPKHFDKATNLIAELINFKDIRNPKNQIDLIYKLLTNTFAKDFFLQEYFYIVSSGFDFHKNNSNENNTPVELFINLLSAFLNNVEKSGEDYKDNYLYIYELLMYK